MDREQILKYIATLPDDQWNQFITEARGIDATIRAAEKSGDWRQSMALKNQQLAQLLRDADENGHPR